MSDIRNRVDRAAEVAADAAVTAVASPAVAAAARPVTHRLARWVWPLFAVVAVAALVAPFALAVLAGAAVSAAAQSDRKVVTQPRCGVGDVGAIGSLDEVQSRRAAEIVQVGEQLRVPPRGMVIAVATALQESGLRNLPSPKVPASLDYPHDTYPDGSIPAGDHLSVGTFQQQPWWWRNDVSKGMDPLFQARQFYGGPDDFDPSIPGLLDIPGWQDLPLTDAAQQVQGSAFPLAYAKWEPLATATVEALLGVDLPSCGGELVDGPWTDPVAGPFGLSARFGQCGDLWQACHTGLDFVPQTGGARSVAVAAGRVTAAGFQADAGWAGQLVVVDHGGGVESWYAHHDAVLVKVGDEVKPGDPLGIIGCTGNCTGTHLHLEIRVDGAPVDPYRFLTEQGVTL